LEDGYDLVREVGGCARAMGDGGWLEAVEFVEFAVYAGVSVLESVWL
jgi:hypothetical protein